MVGALDLPCFFRPELVIFETFRRPLTPIPTEIGQIAQEMKMQNPVKGFPALTRSKRLD
jgi:hypothetical protein